MSATIVKFVVIDKITGNEVSDPVRFEDEAKSKIPAFEEDDKDCGCYIPDSYKVIPVECLK